jgi:hypothetical protein
MTIEEVKTLKKKLKRGDVKLIATTLGISTVAIHYAVTGITKEAQYIFEAIKVLATKREQERKQQLSELQKPNN